MPKIETTFDGDTVWLSIDQMAELFQRDKSTISRHIKNIYLEELVQESTVAYFATVQNEGNRKVERSICYYKLDVIISVGYRVKSKRGTQFRIWVTGILKEYMRKGFALDDERLKNLGGGSYLYKSGCGKGIYGTYHICRKPADFAGGCRFPKLSERKRTSGAACVGIFGFCRTFNHIEDIKSGKDDVSFVLVFKLSRFGRNAADVLSTLQIMQDFGVNLICVEAGIDSSKDAGKQMISVLSVVAEIEWENIRVQTMEGRIQKAREGKWNGGFAPYGYQLIDRKL